MLRSLLVPYDGSRFSERALTFAVPIAMQHGAALVLTMSHPLPPRVEDAAGAPVRDPAMDRDVRSHLRGELERVAKRIAAKYRVTTTTQFRDGPIVDEISAAATESGRRPRGDGHTRARRTEPAVARQRHGRTAAPGTGTDAGHAHRPALDAHGQE